MRTILLLATTALVGCSASQIDAAAYKTCPGGKQVRKNVTCPTPPPSFAVQDVTVAENAGSVTVTIVKTGTSTKSSTISYVTSGGTATAGTNYKPVSASTTLSAAQTRFSFTMPVLDDGKIDPSLTVGIKLTAVTNAAIARNGIVYITDTDTDNVAPTPTQTCPDGSVIPATSSCPAAPPPTPPPGSADTTSLIAPLADIPDNFLTANTLRTTIESVPASLDPAGAFRFTCFSGQLLKDDPIVYPGQPGKSHLHLFFGNTGTNASSTYNSLRTTGGSTCTHDSVGNAFNPTPQRTAYWMPAMLDGAGNAVKADFMLTYYKALPASSADCGAPDATHIGYCVPLPNGLRFIKGYNMADGTGGPAPNSDIGSRLGYDCEATDGTGTSYTSPQYTIAAVVATGQCPIGAWLRVFITLADCWDGIHLDTPDHRSHMVYASGAGVNGRRACPADHPYNIPEIALQMFFRTDANFVAGKWHLASDEMVPGAPAGSTLHFDYWEAWSPVVKNMWKTGCIDGHFSCNAGELGNGQSIAGMNGNFSDIPNHVLVPLSTTP
jgi:hypothetical protein